MDGSPLSREPTVFEWSPLCTFYLNSFTLDIPTTVKIDKVAKTPHKIHTFSVIDGGVLYPAMSIIFSELVPLSRARAVAWKEYLIGLNHCRVCGTSDMDVNGRKPPLRDRLIVTIVEPDKNVRSCVGSHIAKQNTNVEPTSPEMMRMEAIVKKLVTMGTVGLAKPHMGITIAASIVDVKIKNKNSKKTCYKKRW